MRSFPSSFETQRSESKPIDSDLPFSNPSKKTEEWKRMSLKELLTVHLDDYVVLIDQLLDSLVSFSADPGGLAGGLKNLGRGAPVPARPGLGPPQPQQISPGENVKKVMQKIARKDQLLQESVGKLVEHQKFQQKIAKIKSEIQEVDNVIINFASKLGQIEQKLYDATADRKTLKDIDGQITKQEFTVQEVIVFAERLGLMSYAPSDFLEQKGLSPQRPPAPQEESMGMSLLHYSLPDLLDLHERDEAERQRKELEALQAATATPTVKEEKTEESAEMPDFSKINTLKPPPGWKVGDPLRPEHIQFMTSTLRQASTTTTTTTTTTTLLPSDTTTPMSTEPILSTTTTTTTTTTFSSLTLQTPQDIFQTSQIPQIPQTSTPTLDSFVSHQSTSAPVRGAQAPSTNQLIVLNPGMADVDDDDDDAMGGDEEDEEV